MLFTSSNIPILDLFLYFWTCIFVVFLLVEVLYIISEDLYMKLVEMYLNGLSAYAISKELKINYRTVKKYIEQLEKIQAQIEDRITCFILEELEKHWKTAVKNYKKMQEKQEERRVMMISCIKCSSTGYQKTF